MTKPEVETLIASQILQNPALLSSLPISLEDFGNWEAVHIIRAVEAMEREGVKVTKADVTRYAKDLERPTIARIWGTAKSRANFDKHVQALTDFIKAEKLDYLSGIISGSLLNDEAPDSIISKVEEYLFTIQQKTHAYMPDTLGDALRESVDRLEERIKSPGLPGVTTGYHELNSLFAGFQPRLLYYIASRPSQGKTALMLNLALNALDSNAPVGIISIESNAKELADRVISIRGTVNSMNVKRGEVRESDIANITAAVIALYEKPGVIYHNPYATISDVSIQARRMVRNNGAQVIFIDYLQKIKPTSENRSKPRHEQIAYDSAQLKALAEDIGVAVVCLAQINRSEDNKRPTLAGLKGSGAIEEDGDVVMMIYNDNELDASEIIVSKARDGITGSCAVRFIREYLRFVEEQGR